MQFATFGRSEPPLPFGHLPLHEVETAKAQRPGAVSRV